MVIMVSVHDLASSHKPVYDHSSSGYYSAWFFQFRLEVEDLTCSGYQCMIPVPVHDLTSSIYQYMILPAQKTSAWSYQLRLLMHYLPIQDTRAWSYQLKTILKSYNLSSFGFQCMIWPVTDTRAWSHHFRIHEQLGPKALDLTSSENLRWSY
jgi:hypothetical protein